MSIPVSPKQVFLILTTELCILLRVYQLNTGRTSVRNKVFFSARFYCALLTLHVSAPFSGHLQVVRKRKKYIQGSHYILCCVRRLFQLLIEVFLTFDDGHSGRNM
jgi:hypothetical protein